MHLKIFTDGASWGNPGPAAIGVLIHDENGTELIKISRFIGNATNNQAEYQAVIAALEAAKRFKAKQVTLYLDSELVARQLSKRYKVKSPKLFPLYKQACKLSSELPNFCIVNIEGGKNYKAHALAKAALQQTIKVRQLENNSN